MSMKFVKWLFEINSSEFSLPFQYSNFNNQIVVRAERIVYGVQHKIYYDPNNKPIKSPISLRKNHDSNSTPLQEAITMPSFISYYLQA